MKIAVLGLALALAVYAAFPLAEARAWGWLAVLVVVTALIFAVYLSKRAIPAKYLVPGVLFLLAFQVVPVLYTVATAFTNYGDGHRGSQQDAVRAIESASVQQVPGSVEYALSVALDDGGLKFLLVSPDGKAYVGDGAGLKALERADIAGGRVVAADGYQLLGLGEATQRNDEILAFTVPTAGGAIRASGLTRAYTGQATRFYDAGCDCITDRASGKRWVADGETGSFVAADGEHLAQGWKVNVGLANFTRVLTDSRIAGPFLKTLVWNLAFAVGSVLVTFALGLACALALNAKMRGRSWYRVLLVLPYAMPSFAMLLVWRDLFNQDFGLINRITGLHVDWFGSPWTARAAVILVQLWLGYPYMFLVATGALQAIPREMQEAASIDGATTVQRFRRVTLPLLLVALTPLLISSFAFNFNNFNAIYLTTDGAPFAAGNSSIGATDLLITYTYRLAFGGSGAQLGFAAAISVYIFAIVALISVAGFRRSRKQEEVYS
ncbi:ABC transporter permease subunit [Dactylosporangium matsuzakiense]|uniref:Maltose/maltodextrin transport system permease protein n=1 Tax=Dactylosporangium matsuzakiense TaxID=53360 RepID=A0A9W6NL88_9ACTN|nr:ABC transporter permease subunit [Dactylosporangium matsuzakiense]UWZ48909.1 ABC transporter permease subunit [Dactylosporangium matsuzakiense]GLL00868.1 sugar ABC transporter permease [Dactylosporangium matsuzakiense]